jgi:hypothetical protein
MVGVAATKTGNEAGAGIIVNRHKDMAEDA